jgi:chromosomal replication initiation ATPase DnaA
MCTSRRVIENLRTRGLLEVVDAVCALRGVTRTEVCGRRRTRAIALARHELWWCLREHLERFYSFPEIARLFECDHSTVLYGVAAHERRRDALVLDGRLMAATRR